MSAYIRLQELTNQNANIRQPVEDAVDVGAYKSLVLQGRIPVPAGTAGQLRLMTSATLEETSFATPGHWTTFIDLAGGPNQVIVLIDPLRYIRWEITGLTGGPVEFQLDVVAREV